MAWVLDTAHSSVEFSVRHMAIATVRGRFEGLEGEVDFKDGRPTSIKAGIDASTISTREAQRDAHLRSADFLDVENHPKIEFVSREIAPAGKSEYRVTGDLSIRGQARPVTLQAEVTDVIKDPWGNRRIGMSAEGKLNRKDWGLTWNQFLEAGALLVGDEVKIQIEVEATEQA